MKKCLLLLLVVAVAYVTNAQNRLVVFSDDGEKFLLFMNGEQQNQMPEVNVKSKDLNSDSYRVKIAFNNKSLPELNKSITFLEPNKEMTVSIVKNKKGEYVLRLISEAPYTALPASETQTSVKEVVYETPETTPPTTQTVTQVTTTDINTQTTTSGGNTQTVGATLNVNYNGVSMQVTDPDGENVQLNVNINVPDAPATSTTTVTTTTSTTYNESVTITETDQQHYETPDQPAERPHDHHGNQHGEHQHGYDPLPPQQYNDGGCRYAMSDADFLSASKSIEEKSFSDSQLTLAKQIAKSNCMTCDQIKKVMEIFDYESTRLEFAKYAYDFAYDKNNYYKVNDAFQFESTIEELNEFLEGK